MTFSFWVKVTRSERWLYPCAGSTKAEVVDDDVITLSVENEADGVENKMKTRQNESVDWHVTLSILTEKTLKLKRRVHALKKLYVSKLHFFSASICVFTCSCCSSLRMQLRGFGSAVTVL